MIRYLLLFFLPQYHPFKSSLKQSCELPISLSENGETRNFVIFYIKLLLNEFSVHRLRTKKGSKFCSSRHIGFISTIGEYTHLHFSFLCFLYLCTCFIGFCRYFLFIIRFSDYRYKYFSPGTKVWLNFVDSRKLISVQSVL